jgi:hypothetical protein
MTSFLQCPQSAAERESSVLGHSEADNYVRFLCAVSMLRNGSEGHANDAFLGQQFGEQVDMHRRNTLIKNHDPFAVMFDLPDCSGHQPSNLEVSA